MRTTTKKLAPKKRPTRAEAARKLAQEKADRIAKMSPAKRRTLIAECERELNKSAPTLEAANSDLLMLLMTVGLEFVKRFYPDATAATFHISRYDRHANDWSAMIPVPIPETAADAEKGEA